MRANEEQERVEMSKDKNKLVQKGTRTDEGRVQMGTEEGSEPGSVRNQINWKNTETSFRLESSERRYLSVSTLLMKKEGRYHACTVKTCNRMIAGTIPRVGPISFHLHSPWQVLIPITNEETVVQGS